MDESKHAELFKVLSVEARIRIIDLLKQRGPLGVLELARILGITPSAVSQHLKVMKYAGLVHSERKGYWLPYEIDEVALENCGDMLSDVCMCGCKVVEMRCDGESEQVETELELLKKREVALKRKLNQVQARTVCRPSERPPDDPLAWLGRSQ